MLTSSITGYYEEQQRGLEFNFLTRWSIFADSIWAVRWEGREREREKEGGRDGSLLTNMTWRTVALHPCDEDPRVGKREFPGETGYGSQPRWDVKTWKREIVWVPRVQHYNIYINNFLFKTLPSDLLQTISILQFYLFTWDPYLTSAKFQSHCLASI